MNRPQLFRGVATALGVQRKAPRPVIQREEMPKGPRLEEQDECELGQVQVVIKAHMSQRPTPVAGRGRFH